MILTFFSLKYSYDLNVANNLTIINLNNVPRTKLFHCHGVEILNLRPLCVNQIINQIY